MLEIIGRFSTGQIKNVGNSQIMTLVNSDKDKDGVYQKIYYQMFLNEKSKAMFSDQMKQKIKNPDQFLIIDLEGYLKVSYNNNYTNLTIIPTKIKEYIGGNQSGRQQSYNNEW